MYKKLIKPKQNAYNHRVVEAKWQKYWLEENIYTPDIQKAKKPFYNLMMFPYPSAEGLHVGNMYAFTGADVYGRFQRMQGLDVLEPIGLDGFGIHSENYAIKVGIHPKEHAKKSEKRFYEQLRQIGNSYDWTRNLETYDPNYYKWTQWLFVQLFKAGLAYKDSVMVNWCPSDKTVLSDEQVVPTHNASGKADSVGDVKNVCERCGTEVIRREMSSWLFRITKYADRLLDNIETIEWPDRIKTAQRQWIGKSKGLTIDFLLEANDKQSLYLSVWTKFWETIYGVTFIVVSPEYAKEKLLKIVPQMYVNDVIAYINIALNKSDQERKAIVEKSGVPMGLYALNPVNQEKVPIYVADYVIAGVGTGAVMGVPAHDERDFEFARKYKLPRRKVVDVQVETHSLVIKKSVNPEFIQKIEKENWYYTDYQGWGWGIVFPKGNESKYIDIVQSSLKNEPWYVHTDGVLKEVIFKDKHFSIETENEKAKAYARELGIPEAQIDWDDKNNYLFAHEKGGKLINSGEFDGLEAWGEGKEKMAKWMIEKGFARWETNYHLRDWLISRQRYWGPPIPMIKCEVCGWQPVPESDLPVVLPDISDFKPQGDGTSPLHNASESWKNVKCPNCGKIAQRELDVSDTFLDSSWYFLAYPNLNTSEWKGNESPFNKVITKKWLPVNAYIGGAEHAVLHLLYSRFVTMFLKDQGHLEFEEPFPFFFGHGLIIKDGAKMSKSKGNVVNPDEYTEKFGADTLRTYLMFLGPFDQGGDFRDTGIEGMGRFFGRVRHLFDDYEAKEATTKLNSEILAFIHKTIKGVGNDIKAFKYNTAIAKIMEFVNYLSDNKKESVNYGEAFEVLLKLLAPFAPFMTEELWQKYFRPKTSDQRLTTKSIHLSSWPTYDEKYLVSDKIAIIVQVNGKLRGQFTVNREFSTDKAKVIELAKNDKKVLEYVKDHKILKEIFVPGKLINFVI